MEHVTSTETKTKTKRSKAKANKPHVVKAPKVVKAKAEKAPAKPRERHSLPVRLFEPEVVADLATKRSGVMRKDFHAAYTKSGGGNTDALDHAMKEAFAEPVMGKTGKATKHTRLNVEAMAEWGNSLGLWKKEWKDLNPGMLRMNLANRVRAYLRHNTGEKVKIGGVTITAADLA